MERNLNIEECFASDTPLSSSYEDSIVSLSSSFLSCHSKQCNYNSMMTSNTQVNQRVKNVFLDGLTCSLIKHTTPVRGVSSVAMTHSDCQRFIAIDDLSVAYTNTAELHLKQINV